MSSPEARDIDANRADAQNVATISYVHLYASAHSCNVAGQLAVCVERPKAFTPEPSDDEIATGLVGDLPSKLNTTKITQGRPRGGAS